MSHKQGIDRLVPFKGTKSINGRSFNGRHAVTDKIVSVGLLTQRDLDVLGTNFTRHFPVPRDNQFNELLRKLDEVDVSALQSSNIVSR